MKRIEVHLDQLVISPDINPRHATDDDVSDLVAQMRANGFTDALWVRPLPATRAEQMGISLNDLFEVIDGSRRLRALRMIADEIGIATVPVDVIEADDARARELALAANVARAALTPADEAKAFYSLRLGGMDEQQIANHFAVPLARVKQRLALGQLPDAILDALRAGRINLETAKAFTLTSSQEQQLKIFGESKSVSAWDVRRALTDQTVTVNDRRVKFVGLDAYRAAGGQVTSDLFSEDAWLHDEALLDQLFDQKIKDTAKALKDEGWSFVKVLTGKEYSKAYDFRQVEPKGKRDLSPEETAEIATITMRREAISDRMEVIADEDDSGDEFERLEAEDETLVDRLTELQSKPYTQKQIATLGALIVVSPYGGEVEISRGRMANKPAEQAKAKHGMDEDPDAEAEGPENGEDDIEQPPVREAGFSEAVEVILVGAARNALKLAMLRDKPVIARRLGLAARVQDWLDAALDAGTITEPPFIGSGPVYKVTLTGGDQYTELQQETARRFEGATDFAEVLAILENMTDEEILRVEAAMAAHWLSFDVLRNIDVRTVINAVDPDMRAEGFAIDEAFLARLSRDQIALITAEINSDAPVAKGKKPDMVKAALPLIQQSGWLPEQLRTPSYTGPGSEVWQPPAIEKDEAA